MTLGCSNWLYLAIIAFGVGALDLVRGGAPSGTRTPNPLIKSQLLCQLS